MTRSSGLSRLSRPSMGTAIHLDTLDRLDGPERLIA
jgi:hypothetical protein